MRFDSSVRASRIKSYQIILPLMRVFCNQIRRVAVLKGKFRYSLPGCLKFPDSEFSVKIGKLSTFLGPISTFPSFFVDKIFISLLAGITSFAILILDDWRALRVTPFYIFLFR